MYLQHVAARTSLFFVWCDSALSAGPTVPATTKLHHTCHLQQGYADTLSFAGLPYVKKNHSNFNLSSRASIFYLAMTLVQVSLGTEVFELVEFNLGDVLKWQATQ